MCCTGSWSIPNLGWCIWRKALKVSCLGRVLCGCAKFVCCIWYKQRGPNCETAAIANAYCVSCWFLNLSVFPQSYPSWQRWATPNGMSMSCFPPQGLCLALQLIFHTVIYCLQRIQRLVEMQPCFHDWWTAQLRGPWGWQEGLPRTKGCAQQPVQTASRQCCGRCHLIPVTATWHFSISHTSKVTLATTYYSLPTGYGQPASICLFFFTHGVVQCFHPPHRLAKMVDVTGWWSWVFKEQMAQEVQTRPVQGQCALRAS